LDCLHAFFHHSYRTPRLFFVSAKGQMQVVMFKPSQLQKNAVDFLCVLLGKTKFF